jgi:hypothetical protein
VLVSPAGANHRSVLARAVTLGPAKITTLSRHHSSEQQHAGEVYQLGTLGPSASQAAAPTQVRGTSLSRHASWQVEALQQQLQQALPGQQPQQQAAARPGGDWPASQEQQVAADFPYLAPARPLGSRTIMGSVLRKVLPLRPLAAHDEEQALRRSSGGLGHGASAVGLDSPAGRQSLDRRPGLLSLGMVAVDGHRRAQQQQDRQQLLGSGPRSDDLA